MFLVILGEGGIFFFFKATNYYFFFLSPQICSTSTSYHHQNDSCKKGDWVNSCRFFIITTKSAQQSSSAASHNPCSNEIKAPDAGRTQKLATQVPCCGSICNALNRNRINCHPLKSWSISTSVLGCDKKETSLAVPRLIFSHGNTSECSYIRKAFTPFWSNT